jgi:hypothetical protein
MSKQGKIEEIREVIMTGRRSLFTPLKPFGLITWDELEKICSEMEHSPISESLKPEVNKWVEEQKTEEWKARFAEIERVWRSYEKHDEP